MKSKVFHLPEHCREINIEGRCSEDCLDTEKSAEELKNILMENLPCGMYTEFEEKVVADYLDRNCNTSILELLEKEIGPSIGNYAKGFELYRIVKRITQEKRREE